MNNIRTREKSGLKKLDKISGIYEIRNIINDKRYIGQSKNIYARISKHINQLLANKHCNKHLQSAWNIYGENSFVCDVLEYCDIDKLNEKELFWIEHYNSNDNKYGYNIRINPFDNRGLKWSDEQREKMFKHINSNTSYYRNHKIPQEIMEMAWEANRNKIWSYEERQRHSKFLTGVKVTNVQNMKIAQTGESNNGAKLKQFEVEEIIYLLIMGYKQTYLANLFNVSCSTIHAIKVKRSWNFLDWNDIKNSDLIKDRAMRRVVNLDR